MHRARTIEPWNALSVANATLLQVTGPMDFAVQDALLTSGADEALWPTALDAYPHLKLEAAVDMDEAIKPLSTIKIPVYSPFVDSPPTKK